MLFKYSNPSKVRAKIHPICAGKYLIILLYPSGAAVFLKPRSENAASSCLAEFCALAPSTMKLHVCDVHLTETYSRPIYLELLLV